MSEMPTDYRGQLDLRGIIAQIDRDRAETRKLTGEAEKFLAEERKLMAEAAKLNRDRWLAPWVLAASLSSGVIVAVISHFWK